MMNNKDKELLDKLGASFNETAENMLVPLPLKPESVVAMLKSDEKKGNIIKINNKNNVTQIKRFIAIAASFIIVLGVALFAKYPFAVKTSENKSAFAGFDSLNPIRKITGYDEVDKAVEEIAEREQSTDGTAAETPSATESRFEKIRSAIREKYGAKEEPTTEGQYSSVPTPISDENTVSGIQRADIVKSNSKNIFVLTCVHDDKTNSNIEQIEIINALPPEEMGVVSKINISGNDTSVVNECIEVYLSSNTLIAMVKRYPANNPENVSTVALCYDITDVKNPTLIKELVQDGTCVYSALSGSKLYISTSKTISGQDQSVPSYTVDGKKYNVGKEEIMVAVNAPESRYILITVIDLENMSAQPANLVILGCSKEISVCENSIYLTRSFASNDTNEKKTELYHFTVNGDSISLSGSRVFEGSVIGGTVALSGNNVGTIVSNGENLSAYILDGKLNTLKSCENFEKDSGTSVKYIDKCAVVSVDGFTKTVDFESDNAPCVSGKLDGISANDTIIGISDSKILALGENADNKSVALSIIKTDGVPAVTSRYTLDEKSSSPACGNTKAIISNGNYVGIPVIITNDDGSQTSSYILFDISDNISQKGIFNHETDYVSDAATRGTIINGILYTISGEKSVAFNIETGECVSDFAF